MKDFIRPFVFACSLIFCTETKGADQPTYTPNVMLVEIGTREYASQREKVVAVGERYLCGIEGGQLFCRGWNTFGQLGVGTVQFSRSRVMPKGISAPISVVAGIFHTCASQKDGKLFCWGLNQSGELGDGSTENSPTPRRVQRLSDVFAVSATNNRTCAVTREGWLVCWGSRELGGLGDGNTSGQTSYPVRIGNFTNAVDVALGLAQGYVVLKNGEVWRWGTSRFVGELLTLPSPVKFSELPPTISVAAGRNHACALLRDGSVRCWGSNAFGQLGQPTVKGRVDEPVAVPNLSGIKAIAVGWFNTCALHHDGTVSCWGLDERIVEAHKEIIQVATSAGRAVGTNMPLQIASSAHDVIRKLGQGGRAIPPLMMEKVTLEPRKLEAISNAIGIAAGPTETCILLNDGEINCVTAFSVPTVQ